MSLCFVVPVNFDRVSVQQRLRCYADQLNTGELPGRRLADTLREAADEIDLARAHQPKG